MVPSVTLRRRPAQERLPLRSARVFAARNHPLAAPDARFAPFASLTNRRPHNFLAMYAWFQDLRSGLRAYRTLPMLLAAALACVALGMGGTLFIVAVAQGVLLRPPPFPDADRLVRIWTVAEGGSARQDLSVLEARDIQAQAHSFAALEIAARTRAAVMTEEGTERMRGESVTSGYFALIGLQPALGRLFSPAEYAPGAPGVIVISHRMWQQKFGGRADILGRAVRARGSTGQEVDRLYSIVGVLPAGFIGTVDPDISDFWLPLEQYAPRRVLEDRRTRAAWVIARLRAGATLAAAQEEVARLGDRLAAQYPDAYQQLGFRVEPLGESWRARFRTGLLMLTGAAALLLFIACINVAHLLLARLLQREPELRLRLVLGAGRGRILRLLLTESLVLAVAGGVLGILLATWCVHLFVAADVFRLPAYVRITIDARVVLLAAALVLLTSLLFGVLPAWFGTRLDAAQALRQAGRGSTMGRRQKRITEALITAEVCLCFLLLIGCALLLRTYSNLLRADVGYRTERLLRMAISLDGQPYPNTEARLGFVRAAGALLRQQPGVRGVSFLAGVLPPFFDDEVAIARDGRTLPALSAVQHHAIDSAFLGVLDIALRHGRNFQHADGAAAPRVAIVSESLARTLSGGAARTALDLTVQLAGSAAPVQIVGIVEDVRYHGPLATRPIDYDVYVPIEQALQQVLSIAIQTAGDPTALLRPLQQALGTLAPTSPLHWMSTMQDELQLQYGDARLYAWLTGVFGGSAMLLALLGIYGVVTHSVIRRYSELGVRRAVGASRGHILWLVLRQGSRPLVLGLVLGAALALAVGRFLHTLLYGVNTADPRTFVSVAVVLLGMGLLACYLPARRATRLDPRAVLQR